MGFSGFTPDTTSKSLNLPENNLFVLLYLLITDSDIVLHVVFIITFIVTIHFPTSPLHSLLPPPRDQLPITRLRAVSKFPRIPARTKKYQSFLSYALAHYQT